MLNILHVQTGMPINTNACYTLHEHFLQNGFNSKVLVLDTKKEENLNLEIIKGVKKKFSIVLYNYFMKYIVNKLKNEDCYSYSYPLNLGYDITKRRVFKESDVIYLHWVVGGFLNLKLIEKILRTGKPIFFFMHDMWLITGGCHHSLKCVNYKVNCEDCLMFNKLGQYFPKKQLKDKLQVFNKFNNYHVITPSEWLLKCVNESNLFKGKNKVISIPNIVDSKVFYPQDKISLKIELGLDINKKYLLFGAHSAIENHFKGFSFFLESLKLLKLENMDFDIEILIFGSDLKIDLPFKSIYLGKIYDQNKLSKLFNASDVFISPSLAESFGLTLLENIFCKTPVVSFDNTAISEIVKHKKNGYLAKNMCSKDLALGILFCIQNTFNFEYNEEFRINNIINNHKRLIKSYL